MKLPLAHSFFECRTGSAWSEADPAARGIAVVQRFGAVGDGVSDEQRALQAAADFARLSGAAIVFVPPGLYRHSGVIEFGSGTTLQGAGPESVLMATTDVNSALHFAGSRDCRVTQLGTKSTAVTRLYTPLSAAILFENASNCQVSDVSINGSASVGVLVRGSSDMLIQHTDIRGTMADGIHIVDGSARVTVAHNRSFKTGDDSFAAVSYAAGPQTDTVTFDDNVSILSSARGVTCIGAANCSITNNRVYNPASHGIAVAYETSYNTYHPSGATLSHNLVRGVTSTGMNPLLIDSASDVRVEDFQVYDSNPIYVHDSTSVRISRLRAFNALYMGIAVVGGGRISLEKCAVTGAGASGILLNGVQGAALNQNYVANAFQSGPAIYGAIDVASSDSVTGAGNQVFTNSSVMGDSFLRVASSTAISVAANVSTENPAGQPVIGLSGVVGAGLSVPAVKSVSPNGMVSVFGAGLTTNAAQQSAAAADLAQAHLPNSLGGACLEIGGDRSYLLYISPTQINAVAGLPATNQDTTVEVIANCGQANEVRSNLRMLPSAAAAPGFFFWQRGSNGHDAVVAFDAISFTGIGQLSGSGGTAPAYPGEEIAIYMNGSGPTQSNFDPGAVPQVPAPDIFPVAVFLNGTQLAQENVQYFGTSTFAGVYQLNFHLPASTPPGEMGIAVKINGVVTPPGAYFLVGKN